MDRRNKLRAASVHAVRVSCVAVLLLLIPSPHQISVPEKGGVAHPELGLIQGMLPNAVSVQSGADANGFWTVEDSAGGVIARVARTLPQAADVIGYRGPSEAVILVDNDYRLIGVDLIQSADTDEHVQAVRDDQTFFEQFRSWSWDGSGSSVKVDGVSGATLTSLALAKGVLKRVGNDRPSLVFPDPVTPDELARWFPDVVDVRAENDRVIALDAEGVSLGQVIRTGPLSDGVIGYQGPTELLIKINFDSPEDARLDGISIEDIKIRSSFDNEPYVGYCKTEYGFWSLFKGQSIKSLSEFDLQAERVEGVSGATMSSMSVAETLVASAIEFRNRSNVRSQEQKPQNSMWSGFQERANKLTAIRLTAADIGCVAVLLCIPLFRFKGWFRNKRLRVLWLVLVIGIIGFWSGNLVSMALVAGWSAEGMAWQLAPALSAIVVVAFVCPVFGKSNPYCSHVCPHGAIQQLIRPKRKSKRIWKPPTWFVTVAKYVPGACLVIAYLALMSMPSTDLSSWEPFHAYLYRIAPWSAIGLAALTLVFSAFVPMGYCRLGCPTGRLLDYLRRSASSDRLTLADLVVVVLLVITLTTGSANW